MRKYWLISRLVLCSFLLLLACESKVQVDEIGEEIVVVFAHPDDETIISGTLAMLATKGCDISVVYVTSGDDGPDETGQSLHGESLADVLDE